MTNKLQKYLIFFSYNGSQFHGSQMQKVVFREAHRDGKNYLTVQSSIKDGIERHFSHNLSSFEVRLTSRTDAGVHALRSAGDFFLEYSSEQLIFPPCIVKKALNSYLVSAKNDCFVQTCYLVNDRFDSRKDAENRTYVYKIRFGDINDWVINKGLYWNILTKADNLPNKLSYQQAFDCSKLEEISIILNKQPYNFENYHRKSKEIKNTVKNVKLEWRLHNDLLG